MGMTGIRWHGRPADPGGCDAPAPVLNPVFRGSPARTSALSRIARPCSPAAPAYDHVVYLCSPSALPRARRVAVALGAGDLVEVHGLPEGALL
jgi:hypothetical protein